MIRSGRPASVVAAALACAASCAAFADPPASPYAAGGAIFEANCAVCHGAKGLGTPSLAPPLTSNPARYAGIPEGRRQLAMTVLNGLFGGAMGMLPTAANAMGASGMGGGFGALGSLFGGGASGSSSGSLFSPTTWISAGKTIWGGFQSAASAAGNWWGSLTGSDAYYAGAMGPPSDLASGFMGPSSSLARGTSVPRQ